MNNVRIYWKNVYKAGKINYDTTGIHLNAVLTGKDFCNQSAVCPYTS